MLKQVGTWFSEDRAIWYDETINGNLHGAVHEAQKLWLELVDAGFADARFNGFESDDSVMYMLHGKDIVSLIVFRHDKISKRAFIQLGGTYIDHRGNGYYKQLMGRFESWCRSNNINVIETIVSPDNEAMISINNTRKPVGMLMRKST